MAMIGATLHGIRQQCRLSLREVDQRSRSIARDRGDPSYRVSASWLKRLESEENELTVNRLRALAEIYNISIDQLLQTLYPAGAETTEGLPKRSYAAKPLSAPPPDETTLLSPDTVSSRTKYLQAIIGKHDLALDPMVPAGSKVQIDTSKREISPKNSWTHSLQRPIHFLKTNDGYFCGWCELDADSQWLTLIPHPFSSAPTQRWRYGTEVENLGRVVAVTI